MRVDLPALQQWLQIATSIATLIALLIGMMQLRDVRRSLELSTNLAILQGTRQVWGAALTNPEIAPELMKERWGDQPSQALFAANLIDHFEGLYFQYRRGAISRLYWRSIEKAILAHMRSPAIRGVWEMYKERYWSPFVHYIDAALPPLDGPGR